RVLFRSRARASSARRPPHPFFHAAPHLLARLRARAGRHRDWLCESGVLLRRRVGDGARLAARALWRGAGGARAPELGSEKAGAGSRAPGSARNAPRARPLGNRARAERSRTGSARTTHRRPRSGTAREEPARARWARARDDGNRNERGALRSLAGFAARHRRPRARREPRTERGG